jgi:quercetin dioxygenase-like cupin family protein
MTRPYGAPTASSLRRPTISDKVETPEGRRFHLAFAAGQALPDHRNASRILVSCTAGEGVIDIDGAGPRWLRAGESVQIEASVPHALEAMDIAWEVDVHLIEGRCPGCA